MPQNLIWLVKWSRQILGAVIHPQGQPPSRAGRGRAIQPGKPHGDRLQGGEAVAASSQTWQPTHSDSYLGRL